jgi:hypothetical protein
VEIEIYAQSVFPERPVMIAVAIDGFTRNAIILHEGIEVSTCVNNVSFFVTHNLLKTSLIFENGFLISKN